MLCDDSTVHGTRVSGFVTTQTMNSTRVSGSTTTHTMNSTTVSGSVQIYHAPRTPVMNFEDSLRPCADPCHKSQALAAGHACA